MTRTLTACGFILARNVDGQRQYLLLRNARHGGWGFPKGHADPGESELETAQRETREETGIKEVTPVPGFRHESAYDVRSGKRGSYHKIVVYFAAWALDAKLQLSDEHREGGWFTLDQALPRLAFPALQDALQQADAHLARQA
ncbi:MAG: NUDIX domain-containing protein [Planctomycetes bacterium]|nr:NUDIX domain-containing protein [Planctomycetota bacterium]